MPLAAAFPTPPDAVNTLLQVRLLLSLGLRDRVLLLHYRIRVTGFVSWPYGTKYVAHHRVDEDYLTYNSTRHCDTTRAVIADLVLSKNRWCLTGPPP